MTHRLSAEEGEPSSAPAPAQPQSPCQPRPQTAWCASGMGAEAGWPGSPSERGGLAPETPGDEGLSQSRTPRAQTQPGMKAAAPPRACGGMRGGVPGTWWARWGADGRIFIQAGQMSQAWLWAQEAAPQCWQRPPWPGGPQMQICCPKPEPRLASRKPPRARLGESTQPMGLGGSDPRQPVRHRQRLQKRPEKPVPGSIGSAGGWALTHWGSNPTLPLSLQGLRQVTQLLHPISRTRGSQLALR